MNPRQSPSETHDDIIGELRELQRSLRTAGRPIIDLSMVNPDLPPSRFTLDKLVEASLITGNHRYSVSRGTAKLREGFAAKYSGAFGVTLDPEREICVGAGTKETLFQTVQLFAARDARSATRSSAGGLGVVPARSRTVLLPSPTYPAHRAAVELAGLEPVYFPISTDEQAMLAAVDEAVKRHRPMLMLLNFPNNPTGMTVSRQFYERLAEIAIPAGTFVLNDFVYGEMLLAQAGAGGTGTAVSLLSVDAFREHGAETYSLSKAYSIPGWRVGALVGNRVIVSELARFKSLADYGIFLPLQIASAALLMAPVNHAGGDHAGQVVRHYGERARLLVRGLAELGWRVEMPSAGASVWAAMPDHLLTRFPDGSVPFAKEFLEREGVLANPGALFGAEWRDHVRFALVAPLEQLRDVMVRLDRMANARECKVAVG